MQGIFPIFYLACSIKRYEVLKLRNALCFIVILNLFQHPIQLVVDFVIADLYCEVPKQVRDDRLCKTKRAMSFKPIALLI